MATTVNFLTTKVYEAILLAWSEGKKGIGLEGGTYSSKTWSALEFLILIAKSSPRPLDVNIISESVPHLKGGCIKDLFNILTETKETSPFFNQSDYIYRRPGWEGTIQFLSADNEKALGMRRDILFINEGDTLSWEIAKELISRTNIFVIVDWNPRTEFWWHKYYKDDPKWAYDHSTYLDALAVLPRGKRDDIEDLGRKDENYHLVYELGIQGHAEGLVYPQFQLIDSLPAGEPFYGLDYGGDTDPNVLVKNIIIADRLYSQEMFYLYDQDISQLAREMDLCKVMNSPVYPDPANPLASKELKTTHRFNIQETVSGKGSVQFGIKKVNQYYQYWTLDSLNCIKEQRNYRYLDSQKNEDDRPVTVSVKVTHRWSHGMDARRYAVASVRRVGRVESIPVSSVTHRAVPVSNVRRARW